MYESLYLHAHGSHASRTCLGVGTNVFKAASEGQCVTLMVVCCQGRRSLLTNEATNVARTSITNERGGVRVRQRGPGRLRGSRGARRVCPFHTRRTLGRCGGLSRRGRYAPGRRHCRVRDGDG